MMRSWAFGAGFAFVEQASELVFEAFDESRTAEGSPGPLVEAESGVIGQIRGLFRSPEIIAQTFRTAKALATAEEQPDSGHRSSGVFWRP